MLHKTNFQKNLVKNKPTLMQALIPIIFLIGLLGTNVYIFKDNALDGPNQIGLLVSAAVAALIALKLGVQWPDILEHAIHRIGSAMSSILILLLIGSLSGTWLLSGIIPTIVYYGLQILNPTIFLFATCAVCCIVSLATGSSWATIATVGIALLVIGEALGFSLGLTAGAIISGAYFGDKMSPLSDTTNLAPAMVGTDLFTHIRYMMYTTIPSITLALLIYLAIGLGAETNVEIDGINTVLSAIDGSFNITGWLMVVPLFVAILIGMRTPPLPALLAGTLLGGIFAIIFQPHVVSQVAAIEGGFWKTSYVGVIKAMYGEISIPTGNEKITDLMSTSGMWGMLKTIWLILCAMTFGGMMESGGLLAKIAASIMSAARSTGSLIAATVGTCLMVNITASDQYMSIVVPGRMFDDIFRERGLKPENLSRSLEDSGTVTSVLVPWNTCGFIVANFLGVSTFAYAPFCFFNIISPFMSIIVGYLNIKIARFPENS